MRIDCCPVCVCRGVTRGLVRVGSETRAWAVALGLGWARSRGSRYLLVPRSPTRRGVEIARKEIRPCEARLMSMQILYIQTRPYTLYLFTPAAFGPGLAAALLRAGQQA